jgi:hypothetical protein
MIVLVLSALLVAGCADDETSGDARGPAMTSAPVTTTSLGVDDAESLLNALEQSGSSVGRSDGQADPGLLGARPALACVDGFTLQIYEYASTAARERRSAAISPDGSTVPAGAGVAIVEWVAPPRFYAQGRLIALFLGPDGPTTDRLETLLGATITPQAASTGGGPQPVGCGPS